MREQVIKYLEKRSKSGKTTVRVKLYPSELEELLERGFERADRQKVHSSEKHQEWYKLTFENALPGTLAHRMLVLAEKAHRDSNERRTEKRQCRDKKNQQRFLAKQKAEEDAELNDDETEIADAYEDESEKKPEISRCVPGSEYCEGCYCAGCDCLHCDGSCVED